MSAVVLRELVAKLGLQVDEAAFKKADAGLTKVKSGLEDVDRKVRDAKGRFVGAGRGIAIGAGNAANENAKAIAQKVAGGAGGGIGAAIGSTIGKYIGGAAVVAAIAHMTELASSADETNNVLREVFGAEGEAQVHDWSATVAASMGRSKYAMEASAAGLGAMLEPMTGDARLAQEMSQQFAELAVNLGSFFNASDEEALAALKSGITGEAEPLKKFGVVMNDATLAEYAHTQGLTKKLTAMNNAEKTQLRYNYILSKTTKAQGDAIRTADGFANRQKALTDTIRDLATDIGKKLLPVANKMLGWALDSIKYFGKLIETSNVLKAAFVVLGVIMLSAFGPMLVSIAAVAGALLLVVGILDDLITWFEGGDSVFEDLLESMFGLGTSAKVLQWFKEALEVARKAWDEFIVAVKRFPFDDTFDKYNRRLRVFGETLKGIGADFRKFRYWWAGEPLSGPLFEEHNREVLREAEEARKAKERDERGNRVHAKWLAEQAAKSAEIRRQNEADAAAAGTLGDTGANAFANPFQSYSGASVSSPLSGSGSSVTVNHGPTIFNNYLPPGANVSDYTRAQQRSSDINMRRTKETLERTAP
jgi:hypothetical protein